MSSALLQQNNITAHSHAGVLSQLGLNFVATGKLDKSEGRLYSQMSLHLAIEGQNHTELESPTYLK
jgi:uncharacterized protein (UPF0332 family)